MHRLDREPIDVCPLEDAHAGEPRYMIKKGFTRLTSLLFLSIVASELDVEAAQAICKTKEMSRMCMTRLPG